MPDNWGFVLAAYGLAVVVLAGYWRRLVRREREVSALLAQAQQRRTAAAGTAAGAPPR
jgi:heme exporter protein D